MSLMYQNKSVSRGYKGYKKQKIQRRMIPSLASWPQWRPKGLGVAMAMKPGKKVRKGGPKAAWKKKRAVGKTHRDKAQIQQFQDSYDQVSSICSVQFRSDLVGFILTHVLQNITQHPWTTYNVHWTTLHSNIDWNGKSLKPFLLSYKSRYFLNCFLALQSFAPLLPEYVPIQIFQLHVLCYVNSNWKAWKSMR